jgi:hypothetical protein
MRSELVSLLKLKMENPRLNLLTDEKGKQIVTSFIQLVTGE